MAANDSKIGGSQIPPFDLIPDVKESLVPFSIILERSIARIFNDLHILAETWAHWSLYTLF